MSDVVSELREEASFYCDVASSLEARAADEIERLRALVAFHEEQNKQADAMRYNEGDLSRFGSVPSVPSFRDKSIKLKEKNMQKQEHSGLTVIERFTPLTLALKALFEEDKVVKEPQPHQ